MQPAPAVFPPNDAYAARWRLIQQSLKIDSHWSTFHKNIKKHNNNKNVSIFNNNFNKYSTLCPSDMIHTFENEIDCCKMHTVVRHSQGYDKVFWNLQIILSLKGLLYYKHSQHILAKPDITVYIYIRTVRL